jgi:hypothetical protein
MQTTLFDVQNFAPPKPASRSEEAAALGLSLLDFLAKEERLNSDFYGLSYPERMEAAFFLGEPLEYIRYDRFQRKDLPPKPRNLRRLREKWLRTKSESPMPAVKSKKTGYKPWSSARVFANRCNLLRNSASRRFSIQPMREQSIWDQVLQNPAYFGVCPLPTETNCVINPGQTLLNQKKQAAIALETQMRTEE